MAVHGLSSEGRERGERNWCERNHVHPRAREGGRERERESEREGVKGREREDVTIVPATALLHREKIWVR